MKGGALLYNLGVIVENNRVMALCALGLAAVALYYAAQANYRATRCGSVVLVPPPAPDAPPAVEAVEVGPAAAGGA